MTIYYSLTFLLLAAEMAAFCILVSPLPFVVRKRLITFLSTSVIVAKIAYALKISFIFVAILFADALQRMYRITAETELAKSGKGDIRAEANMHARKFYSQRNVYLTGFCLFLSLVLTRTISMLFELINTKEDLDKVKQQKSGAKSPEAEKTIAELKRKLAEYEAKDRDFETLKRQAAQNSKEYDRLASEFNAKTGNVSNKRVD